MRAVDAVGFGGYGKRGRGRWGGGADGEDFVVVGSR
jgi:hypothetical protein